MKKKKNYIWLSYLFIVLIVLLVILFVVPDKFFSKTSKGTNPNSTATTKEFPFKEYQEMKKELEQENYEYRYEIMGDTSMYIYEGKKDKENEQGTFIGDEQYTYTSLNSFINNELVSVPILFSLLDSVKPKIDTYNNTRIYTYTIMYQDVETEIEIYTDLNSITRIVIGSLYYQYNLTYTNVGNVVFNWQQKPSLLT